MVRYRQDTGGIRAEYPKNTRQGRAPGEQGMGGVRFLLLPVESTEGFTYFNRERIFCAGLPPPLG